MVGTINQPQFLLYDVSLLKTLPDNEWRNGFAEIIKHAAIMDAAMFKELEKRNVSFYQKNKLALQKLIQRNALLKAGVVKEDEFEKEKRRLLNFGHTLGHAVEKQYELMHGEAIAIGMAFAAKLSVDMLHFKSAEKLLLKKLKLRNQPYLSPRPHLHQLTSMSCQHAYLSTAQSWSPQFPALYIPHRLSEQ